MLLYLYYMWEMCILHVFYTYIRCMKCMCNTQKHHICMICLNTTYVWYIYDNDNDNENTLFAHNIQIEITIYKRFR